MGDTNYALIEDNSGLDQAEVQRRVMNTDFKIEAVATGILFGITTDYEKSISISPPEDMTIYFYVPEHVRDKMNECIPLLTKEQNRDKYVKFITWLEKIIPLQEHQKHFMGLIGLHDEVIFGYADAIGREMAIKTTASTFMLDDVVENMNRLPGGGYGVISHTSTISLASVGSRSQWVTLT